MCKLELEDLVLLWLFVSPLICFSEINLGAMLNFSFDKLFVLVILIRMLHQNNSTRPFRMVSNSLDRSFIVLLIVTFGSVLLSEFYRWPLRLWVSALLMPFCLYLIAKHCVLRDAFLAKLFWVACMTLLLLSMMGAIETVSKRDILAAPDAFESSEFRCNGPFRLAEDFGIILTFLFLFVIRIGYAVHPSLGVGIRIRLTAIGTCLVALFGTITRGVWISFAFAVLSVFLLDKRRRWVFLAITIPVAIAGACTYNSTIDRESEFYRTRLANMDTFYARVATYKSALQMFLDYPVLGAGYACFWPMYDKCEARYQNFYKGIVSVPQPHNSYLAVLAESGVIGCGAWLMLIVNAAFASWLVMRHGKLAEWRAYGEATLGMVVGVCVLSLVLNFTSDIGHVGKVFTFFLGGLSGIRDGLRSRQGAVG
jgi:O-antigen ligase